MPWQRALTAISVALVVVLAVGFALRSWFGGPGDGAVPSPTESMPPSEPDSGGDPSPSGGGTEAPTPSPTPEATPPSGSALAAVDLLVIATEGADTPYDRDAFGYRSYDHDRNGCDIRNDVLRRDLTDVTIRPGTNGCVVERGVLADPYTGLLLSFERGAETSEDVQIDHVVALADAWRSGADGWGTQALVEFGNDPLNLLAVDGVSNQEKGDADAAEWLPPNERFRCGFVALQVAVKMTYGLTVTSAEHAVMTEVLSTCPAEPLPDAAGTATP